jgi:hypothetical protein
MSWVRSLNSDLNRPLVRPGIERIFGSMEDELQSDEMTITGWLVSITPVEGGETKHVAAAFKTSRDAELAVRGHTDGRGTHITVVRQFDTGEMMHLRMKPGDIKRHG